MRCCETGKLQFGFGYRLYHAARTCPTEIATCAVPVRNTTCFWAATLSRALAGNNDAKSCLLRLSQSCRTAEVLRRGVDPWAFMMSTITLRSEIRPQSVMHGETPCPLCATLGRIKYFPWCAARSAAATASGHRMVLTANMFVLDALRQS
jgi:hypothetical protein